MHVLSVYGARAEWDAWVAWTARAAGASNRVHREAGRVHLCATRLVALLLEPRDYHCRSVVLLILEPTIVLTEMLRIQGKHTFNIRHHSKEHASHLGKQTGIPIRVTIT